MAEDKTKLPKQASQEIGYSGTLIFGGIITGEEYNFDWTGVRRNRIVETMRRSDSTVHQALQIVKLPIISAKWGINAAKDGEDNISPEAEEKQRFIHAQLFGDGESGIFYKSLKDATTCFDFGFAVQEIVLESMQFEGQWRIGLSKLASRKQKSVYSWEIPGGKPGVTQMTGVDTAYIPMDKLLVFTHDKEGENHEGTSLLRYIYRDWDIKDKLVLINAMSLEKHGMGTPVIKERVGQTATPLDRQQAIAALTNMRANQKSYLEFPQTLDVEMLDMKAGSVKDILPSINYHDGRIMTGVLARFMEIGGASGTGSESLAKVLANMFLKAEEAVAKDIAAVYNGLIKKICDLNYSDMSEGYPTLSYGSIADDDNAELATAVGALVTAGAIRPDVDLDNNLRERYKLPVMTSELREHYYDAVPTIPNDDDGLPPKKVDKKETVTEKEKKDSGLEKEEDVKAALDELRTNRNRLIASLSQG